MRGCVRSRRWRCWIAATRWCWARKGRWCVGGAGGGRGPGQDAAGGWRVYQQGGETIAIRRKIRRRTEA